MITQHILKPVSIDFIVSVNGAILGKERPFLYKFQDAIDTSETFLHNLVFCLIFLNAKEELMKIGVCCPEKAGN